MKFQVVVKKEKEEKTALLWGADYSLLYKPTFQKSHLIN